MEPQQVRQCHAHAAVCAGGAGCEGLSGRWAARGGWLSPLPSPAPQVRAHRGLCCRTSEARALLPAPISPFGLELVGLPRAARGGPGLGSMAAGWSQVLRGSICSELLCLQRMAVLTACAVSHGAMANEANAFSPSDTIFSGFAKLPKLCHYSGLTNGAFFPL